MADAQLSEYRTADYDTTGSTDYVEIMGIVVPSATGAVPVPGDGTHGLYVAGAVAHDAVDAGNPLKIGGIASSSIPTAVAVGDRVNAWYTTGGEAAVFLYDTVSASRIVGSTLASDAHSASSANSVSLNTKAFGYVYNGTTWDRIRSGGSTGFLGITGTIAADAASTANPVTVGGRANSAAPADMSTNGDVVEAWYLRNGAQASVLTAAGALIGGDAANGLDVDVTRMSALVASSANIGDVDVLTVPAPLSTTGNGTAATALRVSIASDTTGVLAVTDNAGSLTVDGTVAATQSGTWTAVGPTASDAPLTASPQTVGGRASAATPTAVSTDGDVVDAWFTTRGALNARMVDGNGASIVSAAAAMADAIANPTISLIGSAGVLFNGSTWDRQRAAAGVTGAVAVGGLTASDLPVAAAPVTMGARASAAVPSAVSADGDVVDLRALRTGALTVHLVDASGNAVGVSGGTQYVEDVAFGGNGTGTLMIGRRDDALSTLTPVENDAVGLRVGDKGALWVQISDGSGSQITSFGGGTQYAGDAPATSTPTGTVAMGLANSAAPTDVTANNDAVAAWHLRNGAQAVAITAAGALVAGDATNGLDVDVTRTAPFTDPELGTTVNSIGSRAQVVAMRYTLFGDTADSSGASAVETWWTQTTASGGNAAVSTGEYRLSTTTSTTGAISLASPGIGYMGGQVNWWQAALRVGDTGNAGNIRRWGVAIASGNSTPSHGAYFELSATTLNAVINNGSTPVATAVGSWSRFATSPFTLDTGFHTWEIQYAFNTVWFLVDGVVRHVVSQGPSGIGEPVTGALDALTALYQNVNTSGATDRVIGVRYTAVGRFGTDPLIPRGMATAQTNITNSAATLVAARPTRKSLTIINYQGETVYVGPATVTTSNGIAIPPGASLTMESDTLVQGITAAATVNSALKCHVVESYF